MPSNTPLRQLGFRSALAALAISPVMAGVIIRGLAGFALKRLAIGRAYQREPFKAA
ncbi:MAG: hypothetical protein AAAB20_27150 [Rhizobium sp.]|uniref:hypothetical protein n=1 Tax=Rhizobium sp. TaxID=391 RepID=UPI000A6E3A43